MWLLDWTQFPLSICTPDLTFPWHTKVYKTSIYTLEQNNLLTKHLACIIEFMNDWRILVLYTICGVVASYALYRLHDYVVCVLMCNTMTGIIIRHSNWYAPAPLSSYRFCRDITERFFLLNGGSLHVSANNSNNSNKCFQLLRWHLHRICIQGGSHIMIHHT